MFFFGFPWALSPEGRSGDSTLTHSYEWGGFKAIQPD